MLSWDIMSPCEPAVNATRAEQTATNAFSLHTWIADRGRACCKQAHKDESIVLGLGWIMKHRQRILEPLAGAAMHLQCVEGVLSAG
eukprot:6214567-Pleurochrysis_carterae.AAC.2